MFGFGQKKAARPAVFDAPMVSSQPDIDAVAVVAAIDALAAGNYMTPALGSDVVSAAVCRLADALRDRASKDLDSIVGANIRIGETAISVARILDGSRSIDSRTQGMAAAITQMVASIAEVAGSTEAVSSAMQDANQKVNQGREDTQAAHRTMGNVAATVNMAAEKTRTLADTSEKIASIVNAIEDIASKTNLLALNATIEAARAGEAGKGFAVVAGEVKSLSRQTAQATEDIRKRIESFRTEIAAIVDTMRTVTAAADDGREIMDHLDAQMANVGSNVQTVSGRMAEVSSIIDGQRAAADEIAQGVAKIAELTKHSVTLVSDLSNSIDSSQSATLEAQASLAELDFPAKIVRLAKSDHVQWKKKLADMAVDRLTLNPDELADHRSCRLGKWYYGEGGKACAHIPAFRDLEGPHERVHRHGIEAARLFRQGKHSEALGQIEMVQSASVEVLDKLDAIRRAG